MNFTKSIFTLSLILFVSSNSFAQYKYDIGLKASSYEMERFQLEGRLHLNNPYSIVVTLSNGSRGHGNYHVTPYYNDSLFDVSSNYSNANNTSLKIGVQRKLGFLATNVFYAGASVGFGFEQRNSFLHSATYSVGDSMPTMPPYNYIHWEEINSDDKLNRTKSINTQLALSFGMDVPITKRISINAEIGLAGIYQHSLDYPSSIITFHPNVSGGLRYSFGKREESKQ